MTVQTFTAHAMMGPHPAGVSFLWDPEMAPLQIDVSVSCVAFRREPWQLVITSDAPACFLAEGRAFPARPLGWQLIRPVNGEGVALQWRDEASMFWLVRFHRAVLADLARAVEEDHAEATAALDAALAAFQVEAQGWTL